MQALLKGCLRIFFLAMSTTDNLTIIHYLCVTKFTIAPAKLTTITSATNIPTLGIVIALHACSRFPQRLIPETGMIRFGMSQHNSAEIADTLSEDITNRDERIAVSEDNTMMIPRIVMRMPE